jgi:hypothetical protein
MVADTGNCKANSLDDIPLNTAVISKESPPILEQRAGTDTSVLEDCNQEDADTLTVAGTSDEEAPLDTQNKLTDTSCEGGLSMEIWTPFNALAPN